MPVMECRLDGKPGYKYGDIGHCYTYTPGNERARKAAKRKAFVQGAAIEASQAKAAGKEHYKVKEFSGNFSDVMAITELRGTYPSVPISSDVDYEGLIAGDAQPVFLTLPIGKAGVTSGNKRHYDEAFVTELMRQTLANKPIGLMGHLSETERATAFPPEAVHWVGAIRDGDTLWGKAYVVPGPVRDRIQRYKAQGKALATSIDAFAEGVWDENLGALRMSAKGLRLNQIDIAPADRAGIPDLAAVPLLTTEMDAPDEGIEQESEMGKEEVIQELSKVKVTPQRGWQGTPVANAGEGGELAAIREALGIGENADPLQAIREMRQAQEAHTSAAVKARIVEMATPDPKRKPDDDHSIKQETVRAVVIEMVEARKPTSIGEAEAAYKSVVESAAVTELLKARVIETMGPRQGTPVAGQNGANKYFVIPTDEK